MLQLATPPPSVLPGFCDPGLPAEDQPIDAALMALSLFTVWAVRTGRTLRPVPVAELSAEEIEAFWDDDPPTPSRSAAHAPSEILPAGESQ